MLPFFFFNFFPKKFFNLQFNHKKHQKWITYLGKNCSVYFYTFIYCYLMCMFKKIIIIIYELQNQKWNSRRAESGVGSVFLITYLNLPKSTIYIVSDKKKNEFLYFCKSLIFYIESTILKITSKIFLVIQSLLFWKIVDFLYVICQNNKQKIDYFPR